MFPPTIGNKSSPATKCCRRELFSYIVQEHNHPPFNLITTTAVSENSTGNTTADPETKRTTVLQGKTAFIVCNALDLAVPNAR